MNVSLKPYTSWTRNRTEKGGGGIATAVSQAFKNHAVGAGEGEQDDEFLITRIDAFTPALNVVNSYGEQRSTRKEDIEERWLRLRKELEKVRNRGEFCLWAGDQNKLVGTGELGVPGNNPEVSLGGRLLRDLLATKDWVLVNGLGREVVEGGPHTRKDPATGNMSCLDMFVVSRELLPYVDKLIIDKDRKITPARAIKSKGKYKLAYTDHFSMLLTMNNLPKKKEIKQKKRKVWNLAKENGWKLYREISNEFSDKLNKVIDDEELNIEETMRKFDKIHNDIKYKAFGKVTLNNNNKEHSEAENNKDEEVTEEKKAESLAKDQHNIVEEELSNIKKTKNGKAGQVWAVRKKVIGDKKTKILPTAIIDPETNKLVVNAHRIKEVTLKYCIDTLRNNEPEDAFKNEINNKKEKVKNLLKGTDGHFETTKDIFNFNLKKFKRSGKKNYDFLTKSGSKFQEAVFKLCSKMFKQEQFPESFSETTLHMILKANGKQTNLDSNRFIHCKSWLPRVAESLVVEGGLKGPLIEGSSIYQIGGQPSHRSEELLFVMKSVIAKYRKLGKNVVLQLFDISKFFDKETMEDAILTCHKRKADPKAIRLWFKLNNNTKIQVRTGVGMTNFGDVGAVLGQGMIGGALVSQGVLDEAVGEHFPPGGELQLEYGDVPLAPLLWLDDIINGAEGLDQARKTNTRINYLIKQRGLALNKDKSVCIIIGSKTQKQRASEELRRSPLLCGSVETKEKQEDKWLGQMISSAGLADSVAKTVAEKESKIRGACLEIGIIINDWRARDLGGMETALMLWETCCVPSLLHGAGTWTEISKATEKRLNSV